MASRWPYACSAPEGVGVGLRWRGCPAECDQGDWRGEKLKSGDLFERTLTTPVGRIGLLAEVQIEGDTLMLNDVAVYPLDAEHLDVGARTLVRLRDALAIELAAMGFNSLRVTGKRLSGAAPGKTIDLAVDLTRYR